MPKKLNITQQFLLFFCITSIFPIVFISALVFQSVDSKLNERMIHMLDIGGLYAEEVYTNDIEKLTLSLNQAATFSLRQDYLHFINTGSKTSLRQALTGYKNMRNLDFLNLYDTHGEPLLSLGWPKQAESGTYRQMIDQTLAGKSQQGIVRFLWNGRPELMYVAMAPFYSPDGEVLGFLSAGQKMATHFSFQDMVKAFPGLELRIYALAPDNQSANLLYSSISGVGGDPPHLTYELSDYRSKTYQPGDILSDAMDETIRQETYKSKAMLLENSYGKFIGYLVVSTSEKDLRELKQRNMTFIGAYILFGLIISGLAGVWFKRSIINPLNELARVSDQVTTGNLAARVRETSMQAEIQRTLCSFNRMVQQLHETEKLRSTFISTLTHDLRTPLIAQKRVLKTYEELRGELPEEMRDMNRMLLRNNEHLLDMVARILESYQYEAGKIILRPERFALQRLVQECIEEARPLAEARRISLHNEIPEDLPRITGDRYQLKRVFQNLIGNALENIGEDREVRIASSLAEEHVRIDVVDNGPGINPELLPHLFTRYFTGNRLRQKIGSGLGLYICRMIAELHGGSIAAHCPKHGGTRISLTLPLYQNPTEEIS